MLRITVHDKPPVLIFQVEGALAGPGVREMEKFWQSALVTHPESIFSVDLTGVIGVDQAGIDCLESLYGQGAEFVTADCVMKDVVDQIAKSVKESANWRRESVKRELDQGKGEALGRH